MKDMSANISSLRQVPGAQEGARPASARTDRGAADSAFREQLTALQNLPSTPSPLARGLNSPPPLKFSNHAIDRMQSRGIRFSPEEMAKIEGAVNKAASKGAKDTLLLTDNSALIVSVKDNTVVTVMDKAALKDNVFTNIDSTVVI